MINNVERIKKLKEENYQKIFGIKKNTFDKMLKLLNEAYRKGKMLKANRKEQWRYRIGDYRVIVNIQDENLVVLALEVGHRKNIYNS